MDSYHGGESPNSSYSLKVEQQTPINEPLLENSKAGSRSYCCGFLHADSSDRLAGYKKLGACMFVTLLILLPIIFWVIIPAIIRSFVDSTGVTILSASIINPSNSGFQSSVTMSFSQAGPIPATLQMQAVSISWNGNGGGNLVTLSDSNTVAVSKDPVTINTYATVDNANALANFNSFAISANSFEWQLQGGVIILLIQN